MWRIEDPVAVLLAPVGRGGGGGATPSSDRKEETGETEVENQQQMSFQLEYTISSTPKYARYRILKKNCREAYKPGQEPVMAKAPVVQQQQQQSVDDGDTKDHNTAGQVMYIPTIEPSETNRQNQKVTAKFVAKVPPRWSSSSGNGDDDDDDDDDSLEFCVRLGLFLPPQAGEMEVNFRETNVKMLFENIDDDVDGGGDGGGGRGNNEKDAVGTETAAPAESSSLSSSMDMIWSYVDYFVSLLSQRKVRLKDVRVDPCPLREVDIKLFGRMASSERPEGEGEGEEKDEEIRSSDGGNDKESSQQKEDEAGSDVDSGDSANDEL